MSEVLMIVHLSRHEGIGASLNGLVEHEVACATAYGHLLNIPSEQLVGTHALNVKTPLEHDHKVIGRQGLGKIAQDGLATAHASNFLRAANERQVLKRHLLCYLEIHAAHGTIHIGVHGHYGDIVLYCLGNSTLDIILVSNSPELAENERMVRHDKIAPGGNSLIDNLLVNVKTQQSP